MTFNIFDNIPHTIDEITPDFLRENFVYDEYKVRTSLLRKSNFKKHNQLAYYSMLRTLCNECETMDNMVRRICNIKVPLELVEYSSDKHNIKDYILTYLCFPGTTEMIAQRLLMNVLIKYNILETLENYYSDSSCIHETVYRIINDIDIRPVCKECGGPVSYSKQYHFASFCSKKCQNSNTEMRMINSQAVSKALKEVWYNKKQNTKLDNNDKNYQSKFHLMKQNDLIELVKNILDKNGLDKTYIINDKSIINPYTTNIFFPLKMKGIIFSSNVSDNESTIAYKEECLSKAKDISLDLIFIYEHLIIKKQSVFEKYVLDFYNGNIEISSNTLI